MPQPVLLLGSCWYVLSPHRRHYRFQVLLLPVLGMSLLLNFSAPWTAQWQGNSVAISKFWTLEFSASWIASEPWTGKTSTCHAHCQSNPAAETLMSKFWTSTRSDKFL